MVSDFLSQLASPFTGEELFDHLTDIVYFIKNRSGQYLIVNRTLVDRCGLREKQSLIGRTASEVLRPPFGSQFEAQDRAVIDSGQPLISQLELHLYPSRDVGWCLTTKLPLRDPTGNVVGLVGVSQDLKLPDLAIDAYQHVAEALSYAERQLAAPPTVEQVAQLAQMSRYRLDRRMREVFGLTTGQWLLKLRIDTAQRYLRDTSDPIASIAHRVGYADQSAFTRQFVRVTGLTPREYRRTN